MNSGSSLVLAIYFQLRWFKQITTSHSVNINSANWNDCTIDGLVRVELKLNGSTERKTNSCDKMYWWNKKPKRPKHISETPEDYQQRNISLELLVINWRKKFSAQRMANCLTNTRHWLEVHTTMNFLGDQQNCDWTDLKKSLR